MITIGIISLLEEEPYQWVKERWQYLSETCGLDEIEKFKHPHLSFQGGTTDSLDTLLDDFDTFIHGIDPFEVRVRGMDHFENRVIFLRVDKTPDIMALNESLTTFLKRHCSSVFEQYEPGSWIPHISIALEDLDEITFRAVWNEVKDDQIEFNVTLHNLCIIQWNPEPPVNIIKRYQL